jgi:hypothetical protein
MSSSISLARRSAAFLSANPVNSRYTWPLIILRRYQTPPRFTKAILDLLLEPAIESQAIESQKTTVADERQLDARDLVVQRVPRHAEILCGRVDIEPARLDGRTWSCDGFLLFLRYFDGRGDVSRFHGNLSKLSRGVAGEDVVRRAERIAGRVVRSRPRDQRPV